MATHLLRKTRLLKKENNCARVRWFLGRNKISASQNCNRNTFLASHESHDAHQDLTTEGKEEEDDRKW